MDLARSADRILVARGKKWLEFTADEPAGDDELAAVLLGRSGTLRAPALRVDDAFVVGFHQEGYEALFG